MRLKYANILELKKVFEEYRDSINHPYKYICCIFFLSIMLSWRFFFSTWRASSIADDDISNAIFSRLYRKWRHCKSINVCSHTWHQHASYKSCLISTSYYVNICHAYFRRRKKIILSQTWKLTLKQIFFFNKLIMFFFSRTISFNWNLFIWVTNDVT